MSLFIKTLLHLLRTHLLALALLTAFRLVMLTAIAPDLTPDASGRYDLYAMALLRGLWFDNVVCCAVMLPAVLVVGVSAVGGWWHRRTLRGLHLWLGITYALIFAASAANIPYFLYFTKILNASIWNWAEYGTTTLGMLFGEASYYIYMGLFALATALMAWWLHRSYVRHHAAWVRQRGLSVQQRLAMAGVSLALGSLCLFGVRGRMGYNPIKVSAAYFCQSTLLNNLGVNPMFCLLSSTFDDLRPENRTLHLLPSQQAVRGAQQLLGRQGIPGLSPLAREVKPEGQPTGQNVVMILMESMSAKLMARFGHTGHLT
ncbi:MAG: LTA synthase family protein, partial [Alloprevotella sp.]